MKIRRSLGYQYQMEHGMDSEEVVKFLEEKLDNNHYNIAEMPREDEYVIIYLDENNKYVTFWQDEIFSWKTLDSIIYKYAEREYMKSEFRFGGGELILDYKINAKE